MHQFLMELEKIFKSLDSLKIKFCVNLKCNWIDHFTSLESSFHLFVQSTNCDSKNYMYRYIQLMVNWMWGNLACCLVPPFMLQKYRAGKFAYCLSQKKIMWLAWPLNVGNLLFFLWCQSPYMCYIDVCSYI